jgi:hypothetical protein
MPKRLPRRGATEKPKLLIGSLPTETNDLCPGLEREAVSTEDLADRLASETRIPAPPSEARPAIEAPEMVAALKQLRQKVESLTETARLIRKRLAVDGEPRPRDATKTSAYIEMKVDVFLSYLVSLTYYLMLKVRGVPVRDHPMMLRLVWIRTFLEKLRPVDQRLQYQISKTLQILAGDAKQVEDDPQMLRPGELLLSVKDEEEEKEDEKPADRRKDKPYRPPKIAQLEYTGDNVSEKKRAERDMEWKKRQLEQSDMMRSLREEFTEQPTEVGVKPVSARAERATRLLEERQQYEEDTFQRVNTSKKEKREIRRLMREKRFGNPGVASLDEATDFRDIGIGGAADRRGRGRGRGTRSSPLQAYQEAVGRVREVHGRADAMLEGSGSKRRRKG